MERGYDLLVNTPPLSNGECMVNHRLKKRR